MTLERPLVLQSASEETTEAIGAVLAGALVGGDVVTLDGPLGAGKTHLVRGLARGLGVDASLVNSPTYVVVQHYPRAEGSGPVLIHADAYRLAGSDELDTLGFDRVEAELEAGAAVLAVEWGQRLGEFLTRKPPAVRVRIAPAGAAGDADGRRLEIDAAAHVRARAGWAAVSAIATGDGALPEGWTRCPVMRTPVAPGHPTYPFSSLRARSADLGRWLSGAYTVSRALEPDDLDDLDSTETPPGPATGPGRGS
jgi:tRNA threonylcarbamoyladenosine biosynthesis protein TsaE